MSRMRRYLGRRAAYLHMLARLLRSKKAGGFKGQAWVLEDSDARCAKAVCFLSGVGSHMIDFKAELSHAPSACLLLLRIVVACKIRI